RRIASLKYHSPGNGPWTQEYAIQLERHSYDLRPRLYPDGALGGFYPNGVDEDIQTDLEDLFARAQVARDLPAGASLLFGAEYTPARYGGARRHTASADADGDGHPFGTDETIGGIYQPMQGHVLSKLGLFAQLESGRLFGDRLSLTGGLRFDDEFF